MVTFPSVRDAAGGAVRLEYVPDAWFANGMNPVETRRVAELVLEPLLTSPDKSLGVIAISQKNRLVMIVTVTMKSLEMPPPLAELPLSVESMTFSVSELMMPAPLAELPLNVELVSVSVPALAMPPPFPPNTRPPEIVRPEIATSAPAVTLKIRNCGVAGSELRATVRAEASGPLRMMAVVRSGKANSSVIVPVPLGANVIVSSASVLASTIAARSEPPPSLFGFVTVIVLGTTHPSSVSTPGTRTVRGRLASRRRNLVVERPHQSDDPHRVGDEYHLGMNRSIYIFASYTRLFHEFKTAG